MLPAVHLHQLLLIAGLLLTFINCADPPRGIPLTPRHQDARIAVALIGATIGVAASVSAFAVGALGWGIAAVASAVVALMTANSSRGMPRGLMDAAMAIYMLNQRCASYDLRREPTGDEIQDIHFRSDELAPLLGRYLDCRGNGLIQVDAVSESGDHAWTLNGGAGRAELTIRDGADGSIVLRCGATQVEVKTMGSLMDALDDEIDQLVPPG